MMIRTCGHHSIWSWIGVYDNTSAFGVGNLPLEFTENVALGVHQSLSIFDESITNSSAVGGAHSKSSLWYLTI